jgi:putative membrane protein
VTEVVNRFEAEPNVGNHFAWIRTQLALQRTLMASVRTSVSLIGFGFTVAQFFQRLQGAHGERPEAPRDLGLVLIAAGVVSLAVFTWQYNRAQHYLLSEEFQAITTGRKRPMHTSSYLIAFTVMLIGVAAFTTVFAKL